MNSSVTFCTVLVNVFFRGTVTGGTVTLFVFYHGNGLHGNYRSFIAVKIPRTGKLPRKALIISKVHYYCILLIFPLKKQLIMDCS